MKCLMKLTVFMKRKYQITDVWYIFYQNNLQFGLHPHGVYTYGVFMNRSRGDKVWDNLIPMGSRVALSLPFGGTLLRYLGFEGVNAENLKRRLNSKKNCLIIPGGFEEVLSFKY